jgi:hypothetical protein
LGAVMKEVGEQAAYLAEHTLQAARNWMAHPFAFAKAKEAANAVLEAFKPPDEGVHRVYDEYPSLPREIVNCILARGGSNRPLEWTLGGKSSPPARHAWTARGAHSRFRQSSSSRGRGHCRRSQGQYRKRGRMTRPVCSGNVSVTGGRQGWEEVSASIGSASWAPVSVLHKT